MWSISVVVMFDCGEIEKDEKSLNGIHNKWLALK